MSQHHVGLDVSVKETAICIVDPHGKVVHRATVESHPEVIGQHLITLGHSYARVGLESGPLSPWLYAGLVEAGLPAICVETRHMHAALSARINKTDRNDAMGIVNAGCIVLRSAEAKIPTPVGQAALGSGS